MIAAVTHLLFDLKLKSYWFSRGLTVALSVLFGVILKEFGFETSEILISWAMLNIGNGLVLLVVDTASPQQQHRLALWGCWTSIGCASVMYLFGMDLVLMSTLIVALQPAIREAIHDGTVYVRERGDWPLGVDVASALANEIGKAIGALLISAVGLLIALGVDWLMVGLVAFTAVIILGHGKPVIELGAGGEGTPTHHPIGGIARGYLWMSFVHNGVFFGIQSFLSLALYDLLQEGGFGSDTIGTLGVMLTCLMVLGLMVFSWIRKRTGQMPSGEGKSPMLGFSVGCLALLSLMAFQVIGLWQAGMLTPGATALLIGSLMSLLMAFGGFYTLGTLQLLDAIYRYTPEAQRNASRKRVLHLNIMVCQWSPALVLLAIYGASLHYQNLATLAYTVTGLIAATEGVMVLRCLSLSRMALKYPVIPQKTEDSTAILTTKA